MAMTTNGTMRTMRRLLTGELPFRQGEPERGIVRDGGLLALLRDAAAAVAADADGDVLLAGALEVDVGHVALERDALHGRGQGGVGPAGAEPDRFRPHEQDRLVALLQAARIAPAQAAEPGLDLGE